MNTSLNTISFGNQFKIDQVTELKQGITQHFASSTELLFIDLQKTTKIDSAAAGILFSLKDNDKIKLLLTTAIEKEILSFGERTNYKVAGFREIGFVEKTANSIDGFWKNIFKFLVLSADAFYFAWKALFSKKGRKNGAIFEQIHLMGNKAVGIIALLSLLIGLILSLQSAQQLRQFGANIFLVDLIVISMITEMGPMITAIIVAGRSGSSIAAEIATMQITEELDALKVMALNPLKYVVAPKLIAMTIALPLLTILSNIVGILGGFIVAVLYLDLNPDIFISRALENMSITMWWHSLVKSILFSWIIVLIGIYFGFNVKGGAEGVGKATTSSVVASIFSVIMADAALSLIFYFNF